MLATCGSLLTKNLGPVARRAASATAETRQGPPSGGLAHDEAGTDERCRCRGAACRLADVDAGVDAGIRNDAGTSNGNVTDTGRFVPLGAQRPDGPATERFAGELDSGERRRDDRRGWQVVEAGDCASVSGTLIPSSRAAPSTP